MWFKRILAREILIIFSTAILVGIVCLIGEYFRNEAKNIPSIVATIGSPPIDLKPYSTIDIGPPGSAAYNRYYEYEAKKNTLEWEAIKKDQNIKDIYSIIIIGIILLIYPLRLCYYLIRWSVKTIKHK